MHLPSTARAGISVICLGLIGYGAVSYWANTRTLTPVDLSVTLAPGHIRTGNFRINTPAYFSIQIQSRDFMPLECRYLPDLRTRQISSIGGRPIANQGVPAGAAIVRGAYLGSFYGNTGTYNLDVEVLSPTQELDRCQPRLLIEANYNDFDDRDFILSVGSFLSAISVLFGISLVITSIRAYSTKKVLEDLSNILRTASLPAIPPQPKRTYMSWGITGLRYRRRSSPKSPWAANPVINIPTVSLVCSLVWFVWLMPTWLLYANGQHTSHGLLVSLLRKDVPSASDTSGLTAPLVKIDAN